MTFPQPAFVGNTSVDSPRITKVTNNFPTAIDPLFYGSVSTRTWTYLNSLYWGFGTESSNLYVCFSSNGTSWTTTNLTPVQGGASAPAIAYSGSVYVIVYGNKIFSSTNGTSWTSQTPGSGTVSINDVCWNTTNSLFIATSLSSTTSQIQTSPNGTTWTNRVTSGAGGELTGIDYTSSVIVASGVDVVATSTNGTSWTVTSLGTDIGSTVISLGSTLLSIEDGGPLYVGTSTNGTTWTTSNFINSLPAGIVSGSGPDFFIECPITGNGLFAFIFETPEIVETGRIMISADGSNWTIINNTGMPNTNLIEAIIYNGSAWMAFTVGAGATGLNTYNLII